MPDQKDQTKSDPSKRDDNRSATGNDTDQQQSSGMQEENPQRGQEWSNYRTRELSDPLEEEGADTGSSSSSDQEA